MDTFMLKHESVHEGKGRSVGLIDEVVVPIGQDTWFGSIQMAPEMVSEVPEYLATAHCSGYNCC